MGCLLLNRYPSISGHFWVDLHLDRSERVMMGWLCGGGSDLWPFRGRFGGSWRAGDLAGGSVWGHFGHFLGGRFAE